MDCDIEDVKRRAKERKQRYMRRKHLEKYGHLDDMRGKHGHHAVGSRNGAWSGGVIRSSHGYIKVHVGEEHPLADPNGYAYEHLLVWVSAGRQVPSDGEALHHLNGDKTDNRLTNIVLLTTEEHGRLHALQLPRNGNRFGKKPLLIHGKEVKEWPA